ncbi:MAG: hypothetical protein JEZ07_16860 [Phycisphaerae bacterium]|nr:hypothetical protein [Phycisphaerae bacterium]
MVKQISRINHLLFSCMISLLLESMSLGQYSGGAGTEADPYQIATAEDLINLGNTTDDYDRCFIMTADIDFAGYEFTQAVIAPDTSEEDGLQGTIFTGKFDGNSHIIVNLVINAPNGDYQGLFGWIDSDAEVSNLGLVSSIITGNDYVGGLVGLNVSEAISNSYVNGKITGNRYVGGLAGSNDCGSIDTCYTGGTVNGYTYVGGLVGGHCCGEITDSYSTGDVAGIGDVVGGLVGDNSYDGFISRSYAIGAVSGRGDTGGLAGCNYGHIHYSHARGSVSGGDNSGGLVGRNGQEYLSCTISKSYAVGDVCGRSDVGGLVGLNDGFGYISESYSTGSACSVRGNIGGLVGRNNESCTIRGCYSVGCVSSDRDNVGGSVGQNSGSIVNSYFYFFSRANNGFGIALNDSQLIDRQNFVGFDFAGDDSDGTRDHWVIEDGYMPRLSWQDGPGFRSPVANVVTTLGGSGYEDDPFIIASYDDMMEFRNNSSLRIGYYCLASDIDLVGAIYTEAFIPEIFYGKFYGNGHNISNLAIESNLDCIGFFCILNGSVDKLELLNINFNNSNGNHIGGLAGHNSGIITRCYVDGIIRGVYSVGGLTGFNDSGVISNCYTVGVVFGNGSVGGLVGENDSGTITNCYSTATVNANNLFVGGLVGMNRSGIIEHSYFYILGGPNNGLGIAFNNDQLTDQDSFVGFEFTGDDYWSIEVGYMPRLCWQGGPGGEPAFIVTTLNGTGYENNPFIIANFNDMLEFRNNSALRQGYYRLENDIDLDGTVYVEAFIPEGFYGIFDGNGYGVSNLSIDTNKDNVGFIGFLFGSIDHLALSNITVDGGNGNHVGGLVGYNDYGLISRCCITGDVSGNNYVGGLTGANNGGSIIRSYAAGIIIGNNYVGGLLGANARGIINESYSTATVTGGERNVGGLAGSNSGTISNSYAIGTVSGTDSYIGGLIGYSQGLVLNTYSIGKVSGNNFIGGLVGLNIGNVTGSGWDVETSGLSVSAGGIGIGTAQLQDSAVLIGVGWDFVGEVENGEEDIWRMHSGKVSYPRLWYQVDIAGDIAGADGVDLVDLAELARGWLEEDGYDMDDLADLAGHWMEGL